LDGVLRILLVEDNPGDARLTVELLREVGEFDFEVVHATTFAEGLFRLSSEKFSIVLLDLSLPDGQGLSLVSQLRARYSRIPLVVLTGFEDEATAVGALQAGAQDYLVKGQGDGHLVSRAIRYAIERHRVEAQLIEARNSAEAGSRAKSEFLANMSHELRTPLNAIIGFSEIIAAELFGKIGDLRYQEYAGLILTSGRHLLDVITSVLDFAKSEAGQTVLRSEPTDLRDIVAGCVSMVEQQCTRSGLVLGWQVPDRSVSVMGDPPKLRQILLNLLSNAMKFTPSGGEVLVTLAMDPGGCPLLAVRDSGIGMKPDDIPRALAPFGQIDSGLSRCQEGTGLGLPITQRFAELHGAVLDIMSQPGRGTTISLRFVGAGAIPAAPLSGADPPRERPPLGSSGERRSHRRRLGAQRPSRRAPGADKNFERAGTAAEALLHPHATHQTGHFPESADLD